MEGGRDKGMEGGRAGRGHAHKRQNNSWYEVRGMGNAGAQKPGEMRRRDKHLKMLAKSDLPMQTNICSPGQIGQ